MYTFNQTLRTASGDAGGVNVYFHIHGKGNENSTSLKYGQAVNYTQGAHAKGICAENIVAIARVRTHAPVLNVCVEDSRRHLVSMYHSSSYFPSQFEQDVRHPGPDDVPRG